MAVAGCGTSTSVAKTPTAVPPPVSASSNWLNLIEVKCVPGKEAEFKKWYLSTHMPDVLSTVGFLTARQYTAHTYRDGRGEYMHLYNIETTDIDQTLKVRLAARDDEKRRGRGIVPAGSTTPSPVIPLWRDVLWRQVGELVVKGYQRSGMQRWVNMIEVNVEAAGEAAYIDKCVNHRFEVILQTPGFIGARIYKIKEPRDGRGKFLNLYYLESDDIEATMKLRLARRAEEKKQKQQSGAVPDAYPPQILWSDVVWKQAVEGFAAGRAESATLLPW